MNVLIMTQGLPRSGKSTWAKQQNVPIVCLDAIRLAKTGKRWWSPIEVEIRATAWTMVRALFLAGHKVVILDTTNLTRVDRDYWLPAEDLHWHREVRKLDVYKSVCIQRARDTNHPELIPIIESMFDNYESIQPEENIVPASASL